MLACETLKKTQHTFNVGVPRIFEKLHQKGLDGFAVVQDGFTGYFKSANVLVGNIVFLHEIGYH